MSSLHVRLITLHQKDFCIVIAKKDQRRCPFWYIFLSFKEQTTFWGFCWMGKLCKFQKKLSSAFYDEENLQKKTRNETETFWFWAINIYDNRANVQMRWNKKKSGCDSRASCDDSNPHDISAFVNEAKRSLKNRFLCKHV